MEYSNHSPHADLRIIRRLLKEDIKARMLILSLPGLTYNETLRHWQFITNANLMRRELQHKVKH